MRCPVCVRNACNCADGDWDRVVRASFNAAAHWENRDREGHRTERPVIDGDKSRDDHPLNPSETNHG